MNLKKINFSRLSIQELHVFIFFSILILNIGALYFHIERGYVFNSNTRTNFDFNFYKNLIHCYEIKDCSYKQLNSTTDDPGHMGLFFLNYILFPSDSSFDPKDYNSFPNFVQFFYLLSFWIFLGIYFFNTVKIWGTLVATLGGVSFILFENFYHLAYSNDVYLFPVYGISAALVWFAPNIFSKKYLYFLSIYCGVLEWFRVGSGKYFLVASCLFLLSKKFKIERKEITNYLLILFLSWFISIFPRFILSNSGHSIWHAVHAGLFEEGGVETKSHHFVPNFLLDDYKNEEIIRRISRWSDEIQYSIVLKNNPKIELGSKEYDTILKIDFLNLLKMHPGKFLGFYFTRFFKIIDLNPWKQHENDSHYQLDEKLIVVNSLVFVLILILFFVSSISIQEKIMFLVMLSLSLVGPILIHPTYIMYNISFYWISFLIIYILLSVYFRRAITYIISKKFK